MPLCSRTGKWLGTLCIMDTRSRELDPHLQAALTDLAGLLGEDLELEGSLHQAQAAGTESAHAELLLRNVLDNLFAFVCMLTVDGVLIEINRVPLRQPDSSSPTWPGKPLWQCYWWSYSPEVQQELKAAVERAAQGERVRYDAQVRVKGGELIMIDFMLVPLRDENGRITHLIPSGVDISDRVRFEAELKPLVRIIEEAPDFIGSTDPSGRFTFINPAGVSHDRTGARQPDRRLAPVGRASGMGLGRDRDARGSRGAREGTPGLERPRSSAPPARRSPSPK